MSRRVRNVCAIAVTYAAVSLEGDLADFVIAIGVIWTWLGVGAFFAIVLDPDS